MARAGTSLQKVQFHVRQMLGANATTAPAADSWIYLFRQQKVVTFAHELYVDARSQYHPVALPEHHGKDRRPFSKRGQPWAFVQAIKRAQGKPPEAIPYWILFSAFQLTWSRLSEPGHWSPKSLQLTDAKRFTSWARDTRALQWTSFEAKTGGLYVATLPTPWHMAFAVADQYEAQIRFYEGRIRDTRRIQERYIYGMVNGLRASEAKARAEGHRPKSPIEDNLNLTEVWRVEQDIKDDKPVWQQCETHADYLVAQLERPPFSPMIADLRASHAIKDTRADHAMAPIFARAHGCLVKTKAGNVYLSRFAQQNLDLILWQEPRLFEYTDEEEGFTHTDLGQFKLGRKSVKSYWYFVKAFVEYVDKVQPQRLLKAANWWAENVFGVPLNLSEHPSTGALTFERSSIEQLKRASSKKLSKVAFFAVLDAVNLLYNARKIVATWKKGEWLEATKAGLSVASAVASATSSGLSTIELVTMRPDRFKVVGKMVEEGLSDGARVWPVQASGALTDLEFLQYETALKNPLQPLAKQGHSKVLGKVIGGIGSAFETASSAWTMYEEIATGDTDAALCHGASAFGSALATAGFFMLAFGFMAPVGAAVIVVGSVISLVGTFLGSYLDDNDLEEWVKFSCFGKMAKQIGSVAQRKHPEWAGGKSLAALSGDLKLQAESLERILYKIEPICDIADDHFTVFVTCRFAIKESRLWLSIVATGEDGRDVEHHSFSPWHDFKGGPADGRVRKVVRGRVQAVKLSIQLDLFGDRQLMHPPTPLEFRGKREVDYGWADAT